MLKFPQSLSSANVQRQGMHDFAIAGFKLAHHAAGPGFPWTLSITVALLFEFVAYLAGCVRFRLWLLSSSLVALAVTAFLAFLGLNYAASAHPGGEPFTPQANEVQRHYSETSLRFGHVGIHRYDHTARRQGDHDNTGDGREFVTVKNRKAIQSDYETALRVATFLMRPTTMRQGSSKSNTR